MSDKLFSDNWYLISDNSFAVSPFVRCYREEGNGVVFYVLNDPYKNNYFRVSEEAWFFIRELDLTKKLDSFWKERIEKFPETTPGQVGVISLLSGLNHEGMLISAHQNDLDIVFEKISEKKKKVLLSRFFNFLFIQIPLWDPDLLLKKISGLSKFIFSFKGLFIWLLTLLSGIYFVVGQSGQLYDESMRVIASENLGYLYLCWAGLKFFHEMGHAMSCRAFGGEVHTMGIMLIAFAPMPYVDITSAWKIKKRINRVITGASGVITELFFASIAGIIWANTGHGLLNSLSFNIMIIGSVSTLLFNLNPLLRLDGYYILSDLTGFVNLHERSSLFVRSFFKRILTGIKEDVLKTETVFQKCFYSFFAIFSWIYRLFVLLMISAFIAQRFYTIGVILSLLALMLWFVVPLLKVSFYLLFDKRVLRAFPRGLIAFLVVYSFLYFVIVKIPVDSAFVCRGVVYNEDNIKIISESFGIMEKQFVKSGQQVKKGQIIAELKNPDLLYEKEELLNLLEKIKIQKNQAEHSGRYYINTIEQNIKILEKKLDNVEKRLAGLIIKAHKDGIFWNLFFWKLNKNYILKGTEIGLVLTPESSEFYAVITQEQASRIFSENDYSVSVKLNGNADVTYNAVVIAIALSESNILPHVSLGTSGGGIIEVDPKDFAGLKTKEPFFLVRLKIKDNNNFGNMHRGRARFCFGKTDVFSIIKREFLQTVQKRYRI